MTGVDTLSSLNSATRSAKAQSKARRATISLVGRVAMETMTAYGRYRPQGKERRLKDPASLDLIGDGEVRSHKRGKGVVW